MSMGYSDIKKIGAEGRCKPFFNWQMFGESCGMWLFGGFLAFLPVALVFILRPVSDLTFMAFFNDMEIIYVSVTMSIIALCDKTRRISGYLHKINLIVVVAGVALYSALKCDVVIPVLGGEGLSFFNMFFLFVVLLIGFIGYASISFKEERIGVK